MEKGDVKKGDEGREREKIETKERGVRELMNAIGLRECRVYLRPKGSDRGRGVAPLPFKAQS